MNMKCLILLSSLFLVACATGGNQHLHQSLQPYVGQTATQVRSQLDLRAMGFKTSQKPIQTTESLSYTIFRDMNIPMGTPNISQSISIGAPMPPPSNGGYIIEMKCQIWFDLKDDIVQEIRYTGRAC
ncbi:MULTISPECIES: hypothetical protein [unclassified Acinetobacter]|uniref:hypothetical protein n=1 Tax=unclassified Acinetobacter TaxID=196816 RepID=UPI003A852448